MRQIVEALKEMSGNDVNIYTKHRLFGEQHIQMQFAPEVHLGLGFRCGEQSIYIDCEDIVDYSIASKHLIINGKMMSIKVVKID
jgi:hypothetical protein